MSTNLNTLPNLIIFPDDQQFAGLSNWAVFCDHTLSVAYSTRLGGYLSGTITNPPQPVAPAAGGPIAVPTATPINSHNPSPEKWELQDSWLAGIVYQNIKDSQSISITQDMTLNTMWLILTGQYETTSAAAQTLTKE
ncbi:hypothetical protein GYMLUDRAFT_242773 [Collybiopsis luxurians FD-317 M1]|uniref:Uncharacterized protein n=1 Tax=Collybiopsis luxurians FD-317 M1 TaxID=944289 RepID=A0A0D0CT99_9AGAR|nr:hypothetical protein GYMLUDRAFT_242773 [Collybiopsis luxurians FD-317 M1]